MKKKVRSAAKRPAKKKPVRKKVKRKPRSVKQKAPKVKRRAPKVKSAGSRIENPGIPSDFWRKIKKPKTPEEKINFINLSDYIFGTGKFLETQRLAKDVATAIKKAAKSKVFSLERIIHFLDGPSSAGPGERVRAGGNLPVPVEKKDKRHTTGVPWGGAIDVGGPGTGLLSQWFGGQAPPMFPHEDKD